MRGTASKMWRFGKKVTLWGAAVSSLPILFPILLFVSALGFALAVPLGFLMVIYMFLRKMFAVVIRMNVIKGKGMFGLKLPELGTLVKSKPETPSNEVIDAGFRAEVENTETVESPYESEGHCVGEIDQTIIRAKEEQKRPQSEQCLEDGTHHGDNNREDTQEQKTHEVKYLEAGLCEEISPEGKTHQEISYEGKTYEEKSHEENTHGVETHEETLCEEEIQDLKLQECENQLKHEDPHAMPMDKFIALDTKHKRKEEEEEKSAEMQEIPSKRSRVVEHEEIESQPSTLGEEMKSGDGKIVTSQSTYFSAQQVSQAESPCSTDGPSSLKSECDSMVGECADEMLEITLMPSLEMHVSSESEDDQHSNLSQQDSGDEENVWEQIDAVRKIVGYKGAPNASYIDEIEALYVFMGVEPPVSSKNSFNLTDARQKLEFLKSVVGVK